MVAAGKAAPAFSANDQDGNNVKLSGFKGQNVVLYFYPRDMTPGCTIEACEFRDGMEGMSDLNAAILGVSPDTERSHQKFREKYNLNFTLLADPDHELAEKYGVWKEKNMYGKKVWGIARTTFVIDKEGKVAKIFEKVKPEGHAQQVREFIESME
jgi:peroxiredoxin Q/BCP